MIIKTTLLLLVAIGFVTTSCPFPEHSDRILTVPESGKIINDCKQYFHLENSVNYTESVCDNGEWRPTLYRCVPECGKIYPIVGKDGQHYESVPWEVAMMSGNRGAGSGVIITQRIIIFRMSKPAFGSKDIVPTTITVGVAKWIGIDSIDYKFQRDYKIKKVIKYSYEGLSLAVTDEKIELNAAVQLACIDLSGTFFDFYKHKPAKMAVWFGDSVQTLMNVSNEAMYSDGSKMRVHIIEVLKNDGSPSDYNDGSGLYSYSQTDSTYYIRGVEFDGAPIYWYNDTINERQKPFFVVHFYANWIKKIINEEDPLHNINNA